MSIYYGAQFDLPSGFFGFQDWGHSISQQSVMNISRCYAKFAKNSELPEARIGDTLVIHDTGAHGFSMGYNYQVALFAIFSFRIPPKN